MEYSPVVEHFPSVHKDSDLVSAIAETKMKQTKTNLLSISVLKFPPPGETWYPFLYY
jgi:hypothetical protein